MVAKVVRGQISRVALRFEKYKRIKNEIDIKLQGVGCIARYLDVYSETIGIVAVRMDNDENEVDHSCKHSPLELNRAERQP